MASLAKGGLIPTTEALECGLPKFQMQRKRKSSTASLIGGIGFFVMAIGLIVCVSSRRPRLSVPVSA